MRTGRDADPERKIQRPTGHERMVNVVNETGHPDQTPDTANVSPADTKPGRARKPRKSAGDVPPGFNAIFAACNAIRAIDPAKTDRATLAAALDTALAAALKIRNATTPDSIRIGRFTGRGIMDFQNVLYACNTNADWHFTDAVLCVAWKLEFPRAKCDYLAHADYVGSTRTLVNAGDHGAECGTHDYVSYDRDGNAIGTRRRPVAAPSVNA